MATATAPGPVNLYQLGQALGGVPLDADGDLSTGPVEVTADVDPAVLEAAVAAHVADPGIVPPMPDVPPAPDPVAALVGIVDALSAIGPSSPSSTIRSALIAAREAAAEAIPT